MFCSALPDLTNGVITYATDTIAPFDYLTTATYRCNSGYGPGSSPMGLTRICGTAGEWTGTVVTCDRKGIQNIIKISENALQLLCVAKIF